MTAPVTTTLIESGVQTSKDVVLTIKATGIIKNKHNTWFKRLVSTAQNFTDEEFNLYIRTTEDHMALTLFVDSLGKPRYTVPDNYNPKAPGHVYDNEAKTTHAIIGFHRRRRRQMAIHTLEGTLRGTAVLPGPWRSAVSVVRTAKQRGIELLGEDGQPKGKTRLQADIARKKKPAVLSTTPPHTPNSVQIERALRNIYKMTGGKEEALSVCRGVFEKFEETDKGEAS